jgi:hypothetical protein
MIIASIGIVLFCQYNPDFITSFVNAQLENLKDIPQEDIDKFGKEEFERSLAAISSIDAVQLAVTYFGHGIMIGLFISVILSAILRKQPKTL